MARSRNEQDPQLKVTLLSPEFHRDDRLADVSPRARLFLLSLWMLADRDLRIPLASAVDCGIGSKIARNPLEANSLLAELRAAGQLELYMEFAVLNCISSWAEAIRDSRAQRRSNQARRTARVRGGSDGSVTDSQWREIVAVYGGRCAYCLSTSTELTQDHMDPVSRGGAHVISNIVPACRRCNGRKGARTPLEFIANITEMGK